MSGQLWPPKATFNAGKVQSRSKFTGSFNVLDPGQPLASLGPEEGEIPALAAVAACRAGWCSHGQVALTEAPCDIDSKPGKLIEAMVLDATISVDPIAAIAPPV